MTSGWCERCWGLPESSGDARQVWQPAALGKPPGDRWEVIHPRLRPLPRTACKHLAASAGHCLTHQRGLPAPETVPRRRRFTAAHNCSEPGGQRPSGASARPEQRRPNPDMRRTHGNRRFEIATHTHAQRRNAGVAPQHRQLREVRSRRQPIGRNAHQPAHIETVHLAAARDEVDRLTRWAFRPSASLRRC